jgi:hypothetical protein
MAHPHFLLLHFTPISSCTAAGDGDLVRADFGYDA